jgi:hypothetical protein
MRRVGLCVALACLLASAACSKDDDPTLPPTGLQQRLDASLGDGRPAVSSATGPMMRDLAAAATTVPKGLLGDWLQTHGFQGGYSRVWKQGTELVTALGYHFFSEQNAKDFVTYSADIVESGRFDTPASDPVVPDSRAFTIVSRVQGATRFCGVEYFTVARDAFVITRCADYPVPPAEVAALAQRQLVHAVTETG